MLVRNSSGDLITIDVNGLNEKQLYNLLWSVKFGKKLAHTGLNTVSVEKMRQYLSSKCYSI